MVAAMPGNRSVGTLLNAVPGLVVNDGALAASPTMTFFAARGGPINEGRMAINGMTIAAPFNGGGVSTYILDSINVDEVSVSVGGGLGETDIGGPVMNLVPRSGGNSFRGSAFINNAGDWSRGNNLNAGADGAAAGTESPGNARHHQLLRRERVVRRPDQARSTLVLWQLSQPGDGGGGAGHRLQREFLRRLAVGLGGRSERHAADAAGTRVVHREDHGAGLRQTSHLVQPGVPAPLRGVDTEARKRQRLQPARCRLGCGGSGQRTTYHPRPITFTSATFRTTSTRRYGRRR